MENNQTVGDVINSILFNANTNNQIESICNLINTINSGINKDVSNLKNNISELKRKLEKTKNKKDNFWYYYKNYFFIFCLSVICSAFFMGTVVLCLKYFEFSQQISLSVSLGTTVGIIATFIVVGNYMQVREIKEEFKKETDTLEREFNRKIEIKEKEMGANISFALGVVFYKNRFYDFTLQAYINALEEYIELNNVSQSDVLLNQIIQLIKTNSEDKFNNKYTRKEIFDMKNGILKSLKLNNFSERSTFIYDFIDNLKYTD